MASEFSQSLCYEVGPDGRYTKKLIPWPFLRRQWKSAAPNGARRYIYEDGDQWKAIDNADMKSNMVSSVSFNPTEKKM